MTRNRHFFAVFALFLAFSMPTGVFAANSLYPPHMQPLNVAGYPYPGAKLYCMTVGGSWPGNAQAVYSDYLATVALSNPVVADGAGKFPTMYLPASTGYKFWLTDSSGNTLWTDDNAYGSHAEWGGTLNFTSTTSSPAITASNSNTGPGVSGISTGTGPAIQGSSGSGTGATLYLVPQTTAPATPAMGYMWVNSTNGQLEQYNGSSWILMGGYTNNMLSMTPSAAPASCVLGNVYVTTSGVLTVCTVAGTPGTWHAPGQVRRTVVTASVSPWTPTDVGAKSILFNLYGGGGGGGGGLVAGTSTAGGGAAGGQASILVGYGSPQSLSINAAGYDIVIGTAGAGGVGVNSGGTGAATTIAQHSGGVIAQANGGSGGGAVSGYPLLALGGSGPSGGSGDTLGGGQAGGNGASMTNTSVASGAGGSSPVGVGGQGASYGSFNASGYAAGGGGAGAVSHTGSGNMNGGAGTAGLVEIIEQF